MEMVKERVVADTSTESREAQEHNAQIRERYLRLQSMEAEQFARDEAYTPVQTHNMFTQTEERFYPSAFSTTPAMEQAPQVTEFANRFDSPVFTTEKFERFTPVEEPVAAHTAPTYTPVYTAPVFETDVTTRQAEKVETPTVASYQLNLFAKLAICVFAVVVIALLAWIGVNSRSLDRKQVELHNLQMQKQVLLEDNAELQRRITEAKSEETIREYAQSQGIVID